MDQGEKLLVGGRGIRECCAVEDGADLLSAQDGGQPADVVAVWMGQHQHIQPIDSKELQERHDDFLADLGGVRAGFIARPAAVYQECSAPRRLDQRAVPLPDINGRHAQSPGIRVGATGQRPAEKCAEAAAAARDEQAAARSVIWEIGCRLDTVFR